MIAPSGMTPRPAYESHPSVDASMDDFEAPREFSPTIPDIPSQHSSFRSNVASEYSDTSSRRSYSPPAWRKAGSGWFKHHHQPSLSPTRASGYMTKDPSPPYHSADDEEGDTTVYRTAAKIPLPESPTKGRSPSNSPEPETRPAVRTTPPVNIKREDDDDEHKSDMEAETPTQANYFRLSTRLDVVQRTQPIEDAILGVRKVFRRLSKSRTHTFLSALSLLLAYMLAMSLVSTPKNGPVPDLIKVAGLTKSLEPAIYYSERGHAQIKDLQETSIAVWDLGESVRSTNMTSAPIIVRQLDDLSDSIKTLSLELTSFFSAVDGDIDNILLTMEWAQRELMVISATPQSTMSSIWSNAHSILSQVGLQSAAPLAQSLLGMTHQQMTRATLERVFTEYLNVLEGSIDGELTWSIQLFSLFEAIDKQFLNLQRTVIREQDTQEKLESDFLGSLWTKVIGVNASKLRKYEKNKDLLASVRDRTIRNKHVLADHNQRLLQLKSNLEILRRKLVSPLVRSQNSSTMSVDEQLRGLEGTYSQLKSSRDVQKRKVLEMYYGSESRQSKMAEIEGAR